MKALNHPNIVRLYEVIDDPDEDLLFMVMELVEGGDLAAPYEKKRVVPEEELRVWLRGLTLGLEHLHLSGVCHRDLKPENMLWDPVSAQVKLADFGISGFVTADMGGDFLTSTGGSMPFFAPEMCRAMRGAGYSGRAADVWACGVSLFMWMYHALPYSADNPPELMNMIANEEVVYPEDSTHSASLIELLHGLLERAPRQRLRVRDIRRNKFLTRDGDDPLPTATAVMPGAVAVPKADLSAAIKRVTLMQKTERNALHDAPAPAPVGAAPSDAEVAAASERVSKMAAEAAEAAQEEAEAVAEEAAAAEAAETAAETAPC